MRAEHAWSDQIIRRGGVDHTDFDHEVGIQNGCREYSLDETWIHVD